MFSKLLDSPLQLTIILVLLVVLFGWKRLPDAARGLGRSMRIFRSEVRQLKAEADGIATDAFDLTADDDLAGEPAQRVRRPAASADVSEGASPGQHLRSQESAA